MKDNIKVSLREQKLFAELSGDYNPIHHDPVIARRVAVGGQPIVYGMLLVLKVLDTFLEAKNLQTNDSSFCLQNLKADFLKPVFIDEPFSLRAKTSINGCILELLSESEVKAKINLALLPTTHKNDKLLIEDDVPPKGNCCDLDVESIKEKSGRLDLYLNLELARKICPIAISNLPIEQVALLVTLSRLVGMQCPGYHSLFSALTLTFSGSQNIDKALVYQVEGFDDRFSLFDIKIRSSMASGHIKAFYRSSPKRQCRYQEIKAMVNPEQFKGQNVLVVGGSRGLGEVASKLLCAGGAKVVATYCKGKNEAKKLAESINGEGGNLKPLQLDVLDESTFKGLKPNIHRYTHVYYFATPYIFMGSSTYFSHQLFKQFYRYYVEGFEKLVKYLAVHSDNLKVFYPSSSAIEEKNQAMKEYVLVKVAGEELCSLLSDHYPNIEFRTVRLGRMETDQTQSLGIARQNDNHKVLLEHLMA